MNRLASTRFETREAQPAVERVPDLVRRRIGHHAEDRVEVRHRELRARLSACLQSSMRPWSPESSTSGTPQPRNSGGRVYCGYSFPPSSSDENVSFSADSFASAPGWSRAIASTSTIAGSSPPERTYGPSERVSEQS